MKHEEETVVIKAEMENKRMKLNDEQLEAVNGAGKGILDYIGDGIGYLFDKMTDKMDKLFGQRQDGCTGKQTVPGFNVYY